MLVYPLLMCHHPCIALLSDVLLEWFVDALVHQLQGLSVTFWNEIYFNHKMVQSSDAVVV